MADIAEGQSGTDPKMLKALQGLLAKLGVSGQTVMSIDNLTKYIINSLAKKYNVDAEDVAGALSSQGKSLRTVISAANTYDRTLKALEKFAPNLPTPSIPGKGSLSNDEIWERLGWKSVKGGGKIWTRPPNVRLSEWFPPQFSRYIADYEESPSASAASSAIASDSPMLPVTMEQAKEFRRQDKMWERIDKARNMAFARQYQKEYKQKENVRVEMMDEHDRFIYENTDRFGKAGAEQMFRQRLLKELPPFFKDSKLSTKSLLAISKSLAGVKKTPFIGPMLGRMVQNPVAGVSAAAYGAIVSAFAASDKSNATVTGWQNAVNLYGMPSKEFQNAAYLAGLKDPGEISRLYGKLTAQFGDPEATISSLGPMMGRMSARERTLVASSIPGMDETTMAIIDMMSKNGHLTPDQSRRVAANKSKTEVIRKLGFTSESGIGDFLQSTFLSVPGMSGAAARDMESTGHVRKGFEDALDVLQFENIQKNIKAAGEAAESLNESESSGGSTTNNSVSNNSHAVYINRVDVNTDNPEDFIRNMEGLAERTSGSHANILNSMDSRVMV